MSTKELSKTYNPGDFEDRLYKFWDESGFFKPAGDPTLPPFVVVIPPPNVTGMLHMGHGLNNSLQDVLVRYWRMKGRPTLWVPGTDHAGIATQQIVEKRLAKEGKSRHDLGREKFVELTWQVKDEHHAIITKQLKKIGASVDWSRERFTMDEGLSLAVRKVFVDLFKKGLVYRGFRLVNWDPDAQTAIADDEVEYKEVNGFLYHINYPLADGTGFLEVATTRPETMLGDSAVAVHPEDPRFAHLIGKTVRIPIANREIPIIGDTMVDREFGTGALKITPAHDPNDFEAGKRHNLPQINILNPDGTLGPNVPESYNGLPVKKAREKIVGELTALELLVKQTPHKQQVGHCYRSGAVIEPYLSEQWFVKMKPLAEKAIKALKDGQIKFYPKRWENTYMNWMDNIRDWCISRQLWWGHQIPVWTCGDCGHQNVEVDAPKACSSCGKSNLVQDNDVLDTWFSSWLWPFSTLGWPEKTPDLAKFYPTTALVTGFDIIFFWVARMVMAGLEFTGQVPFKDIYLHQLIRDKQGRKMSKSLGNGIDPLDVVQEYGADAMKFTLAYLSAQGQDILMDKESFKLGSKFANKIWNASRYLLMNIPETDLLPQEKLKWNDMDKWIRLRLNDTIRAVDTAMENYRFNDAGHAIYDYFWNDYCDWYIEASKVSLYSEDAQEKLQAASKLVLILEESLRLMHPFLSFITEEIYQKLPGVSDSLVIAPYPKADPDRDNPELAKAFEALQELVRGIRAPRSEFAIPPDKDIPVVVALHDDFPHAGFFRQYEHLVKTFAGCSSLSWKTPGPKSSEALVVTGKGWDAELLIKSLIDIPKEMDKLKKSMAKMEGLLSGIKAKLSNQGFMASAPADIVDREKEKLVEFASALDRMGHYLKDLET